MRSRERVNRVGGHAFFYAPILLPFYGKSAVRSHSPNEQILAALYASDILAQRRCGKD